ncbi:MAG: hypothetical protein ACR2NJ_02795 [Acidimicrobiales bacterium]
MSTPSAPDPASSSNPAPSDSQRAGGGVGWALFSGADLDVPQPGDHGAVSGVAPDQATAWGAVLDAARDALTGADPAAGAWLRVDTPERPHGELVYLGRGANDTDVAEFLAEVRRDRTVGPSRPGGPRTLMEPPTAARWWGPASLIGPLSPSRIKGVYGVAARPDSVRP